MVFIRKERLGSDSRPDTIRVRSGELRPTGRTIAQVATSFLEKKQADEAARKAEYESNAEMQHRRHQMTPEQRTRESIERMIPTAKAVHQLRTGEEATDDQARAVVEKMAYKIDEKKKETTP